MRNLRRCGSLLGHNLFNEKGQSLVLVAISMTAFIAILGLVIDVGYAFARYRQMQTAADAAALAGTRELAYGNGELAAISRMEQLLESNGADVNMSTYEVVDDRAVVEARAAINPVFTPIFGLHQFEVGADSEAVYGQSARMTDILPFAVDENLWVLEQEVNIWTGQTGPGGNYGWIRWPGQSLSASVLRDNIDDASNSGVLHIGDGVAGRPGLSISSVRPSLEAKIGQVVNIFFYNSADITGEGANLRYNVSGFGKFLITEIRASGASSEISGYFVQTVVLGGQISPGSTRGVMATGLTQ